MPAAHRPSTKTTGTGIEPPMPPSPLPRSRRPATPGTPSDNGRAPLPFATPAGAPLSLQPAPSHQTQTTNLQFQGLLCSLTWRSAGGAGNVDKKSARKWVRESIEWEATGMRTRGTGGGVTAGAHQAASWREHRRYHGGVRGACERGVVERRG